MSTENASSKLLNGNPVSVIQVLADDGTPVWIEAGVNPDRIFQSKRTSKWPFSWFVADLICEHVANGKSLTQVCSGKEFPSYNVVAQWRRDHPEFNKALKEAYEDRASLFEDELIELAREHMHSPTGQNAAIKLYKWIVDREDRKLAISEISKRKEPCIQFIVTGIPGRDEIKF